MKLEENKPIAGFGCGINLIDSCHDWDQNSQMSKWTTNFFMIHPNFDYSEKAVDELVNRHTEDFKNNLMLICGYCDDPSNKDSSKTKWIRHPDDNGRIPLKELLEGRNKKDIEEINERYEERIKSEPVLPLYKRIIKKIFNIP